MSGSPTETDIRRSLRRLVLALESGDARVGHALGVGSTELAAIRFLAHADGPTPSQIGRRLRLSSGGASALLQRLDDLGWIRRNPHPTDRRSSVLRLTTYGVRRLGAATAAVDEAIDAVTDSLSPPERAIVRRWLDELANTVEREVDEPRSCRLGRRHPEGFDPPCLWS